MSKASKIKEKGIWDEGDGGVNKFASNQLFPQPPTISGSILAARKPYSCIHPLLWNWGRHPHPVWNPHVPLYVRGSGSETGRWRGVSGSRSKHPSKRMKMIMRSNESTRKPIHGWFDEEVDRIEPGERRHGAWYTPDVHPKIRNQKKVTRTAYSTNGAAGKEGS